MGSPLSYLRGTDGLQTAPLRCAEQRTAQRPPWAHPRKQLQVPISCANVLLRGAQLKNTMWIFGLVIYTVLPALGAPMGIGMGVDVGMASCVRVCLHAKMGGGSKGGQRREQVGIAERWPT